MNSTSHGKEQNMQNKDIDFFEYQYDGTNILDKFKQFLGKATKKYVALIPSYLTVLEKPVEELNLSGKSADIIELRVLDRESGEAIYGRNLTGLARLNAMFPTRQEQVKTGIKPYYPEFALYRTEFIKNALHHLPLGMRHLNWGLLFAIQVIIYFYKGHENKAVEMLNDKTYAEVNKVVYKKVEIASSAEYVSKLLSQIGVKTPYFESYNYWSNSLIREGVLGLSKQRTLTEIIDDK